ncbi:MAG: carbohydrate kinase family protein [Planctomycetota bacterium]|jgi:fructokinase
MNASDNMMNNVFDICPLTVGLGEILWDMLPHGKLLGGAPANFAYHCHALGADAKVLSAIGDDQLGREIIDELNARQVNIDYIDTNSHPTGTVDVLVGNNGDAHYTINEDVAWDFIGLPEKAEKLARRCDAVCFGSLAQRSAVSQKSIRAFLSKTKPDCLRVFDINLRQNYYSADIIESSLQAANVFKLNDDELKVLQGLLKLPNSTNAALAELLQRYQLNNIALTKGSAGSTMMNKEKIHNSPSIPVEVQDTVGAGDSFTAMMVMGLLAGLSLDKINQLAGRLAAFVCSQSGATPKSPVELISEIKEHAL